jgi:hypothetical protein
MKSVITLLIISFLCGCSTGYKIEENNVYWVSWDEGRGKVDNLLEEAHPEYFDVLEHPVYAKDNNNAFYKGVRLKGVDISSFRSIHKFHAVDKNQAYYGHMIVNDSDGKSFKVVDGNWAVDKFDYFYHTKPLKVCDYDTFEITDNYFNSWARDSQCAYFMSSKVPIKDRESFIILEGGYSKDKHYVYYENKIMTDADAITFRMIKGTYMGKDKNSCYSSQKKIPCLTN